MKTYYKCMQQVKADNKLWFRANEFFNTELETDLLHGSYFITSERMDKKDKKRYTIRHVMGVRDIRRIGEFMQYGNIKTAIEALKQHITES